MTSSSRLLKIILNDEHLNVLGHRSAAHSAAQAAILFFAPFLLEVEAVSAVAAMLAIEGYNASNIAAVLLGRRDIVFALFAVRLSLPGPHALVGVNMDLHDFLSCELLHPLDPLGFLVVVVHLVEEFR